MEPNANKTFELAMFSLKAKKGLENYLGQYEAFKQAIAGLDGFEQLNTYQNALNPNEIIDVAQWSSLDSALAASKKVESSGDFAQFFNPIQQVDFFQHARWLGGLSAKEQPPQFLELYIYKVDKDRKEDHLRAKEAFANFLQETVPGFRSLNWFETVGEEQLQIDLYGYDLFQGILQNNQGVEAHETSLALMSTIAELRTFKTFVPFRVQREKYDITKDRKDYYKPKKQVEEIDLPGHYHLSVNGVGAPESKEFDEAVGRIYKLAYAIKFLHKALGLDFVVPKMEGFWYVEGEKPFAEASREEWCWEIMIPLPSYIHPVVVKSKIDELDLAEFVQLKEQAPGKHVQMLHIGSYEQEDETLEAIHGHIESNDLKFAGYHREIYLTDPRRTPEEKLRTIIRYQVA